MLQCENKRYKYNILKSLISTNLSAEQAGIQAFLHSTIEALNIAFMKKQSNTFYPSYL